MNVVLLGFLGSIIGMLTLGYLGDKIGRKAATTITLSLMSFGALASAVRARMIARMSQYIYKHIHH
jgi:MFS family permease